MTIWPRQSAADRLLVRDETVAGAAPVAGPRTVLTPRWQQLALVLGQWGLANVATSALAVLLLFPGLPFIHLFANAGGLMGVFVLVALAGLPIAAGQVLVLRHWLPRPVDWARAVALGGLAGVALGFFPALTLAEVSPVGGLALLGGIAGLIVGLAQGRVVPLPLVRALGWVGAQGLGCAAAWWFGLGMLRWEQFGSAAEPSDTWPLLLAGAISGLVYGLVTGPVLLSLLPPAPLATRHVSDRPVRRGALMVVPDPTHYYRVWDLVDGAVALGGDALSARQVHERYPWLRDLVALRPSVTDRRVTLVRLVTSRRWLLIASRDARERALPVQAQQPQPQRYHIFEWLGNEGTTTLDGCSEAEVQRRIPPLAAALAGDRLVELLVTTPGWLLNLLPDDQE